MRSFTRRRRQQHPGTVRWQLLLEQHERMQARIRGGPPVGWRRLINLAGTPPRAKEGYPSVEALADAASRAESAHSQVAIGTRPWNPQYRSQQVGNSASPVRRSRTDSTSSVMSTSDAGPPPGWSRGRRTSWIDESFDQDEVSDTSLIQKNTTQEYASH